METATHALRLVFSGVFDRFPDAKLILGHMGETIPFLLWRFDSRWEISNRGEMRLDPPPSEYFKRNVWYMTSGACADAPLQCSIDAAGIDRIIFSVDYPFEKPIKAGEWIEAAPLSDEDRRKVCYENAQALLNL